MSPEAASLFREIDRNILFEDAAQATRLSLEDPDASFWACSGWRGKGRYREPKQWRGYVKGLWCMQVTRAWRGLFYPAVIVAGVLTPLRPFTTGRDAQRAAYEELLASTDKPATKRLPYKPRRKPKTPEANEAAKSKALEVEAFRLAFNQKHRYG